MSRPTILYLITVFAISALLYSIPYTRAVPDCAKRNTALHGNAFQPLRQTEFKFRIILLPNLLPPEDRRVLTKMTVNMYNQRGDIMINEDYPVNATDKSWPQLRYQFKMQPAATLITFYKSNNDIVAKASAVIPPASPDTQEQSIRIEHPSYLLKSLKLW
ncbi:hypothetical protein IJT17_03700 [bacterium]|nr:hypothetical protein [bacterium]